MRLKYVTRTFFFVLIIVGMMLFVGRYFIKPSLQNYIKRIYGERYAYLNEEHSYIFSPSLEWDDSRDLKSLNILYFSLAGTKEEDIIQGKDLDVSLKVVKEEGVLRLKVSLTNNTALKHSFAHNCIIEQYINGKWYRAVNWVSLPGAVRVLDPDESINYVERLSYKQSMNNFSVGIYRALFAVYEGNHKDNSKYIQKIFLVH